MDPPIQSRGVSAPPRALRHPLALGGAMMDLPEQIYFQEAIELTRDELASGKPIPDDEKAITVEEFLRLPSSPLPHALRDISPQQWEAFFAVIEDDPHVNLHYALTKMRPAPASVAFTNSYMDTGCLKGVVHPPDEFGMTCIEALRLPEKERLLNPEKSTGSLFSDYFDLVMTKMGVGLGGKSPEVNAEAPPLEKKQPLPEAEIDSPRAGLSSRLYEVTFGLSFIPAGYEGIDWHFIWRVSHVQFFLSMISSLCLLMSLHFTGFNVFRFTSSAWATYLACVSVVGIRAGRYRNYSYLVAYTGMVTFQTVIYMSSLCWLAYSLYALDYHVNYAFRGHGYAVGIISHDCAIGLIIIEIVALLCTIFTGFFGLCTVCRGLGAMMQEIEALIMEARGPPPQITVRPLV